MGPDAVAQNHSTAATAESGRLLKAPWQNSFVPVQPAPIPPFLYGTAWKEERTAALVEQAVHCGFRGIDTANQRSHYFEAGVGEGLAACYGAGVITRADLFLQTKFTYRTGQDRRLPYDPSADLSVQVAQSLGSSLEHLGSSYVDSYLLHGPASAYTWTDADAETWSAMAKEQSCGRVRTLGVSNVSPHHLQQLLATQGPLPAFVQNRCYASLGWDREVRQLCGAHGIIYQGFSLLTANLEVLRHPLLKDTAARAGTTPAQIVFAFARAIGILPLTGTSSTEHAKQDLASVNLQLAAEIVRSIESLAG